MPASRLLYMHDFPGMYHSISQVVYFHNPQYQRRRQPLNEVRQIARGAKGAVHLLPVIYQIYPSVESLHEDDFFSLVVSKPQSECFKWIFMGNDVYLAHYQDKGGEVTVYGSDNISILVLQYEILSGIDK